MRSFTTEGIVLKRSNSGEADRIVTLFTRDFGKMVCVAKGVRKMTSSKRSALEPGTHSKVFCVRGNGLPILTQAQLIADFPSVRESLAATRNLIQILEIVDAVTVEEEGQEQIFDHVVQILAVLNAHEVDARPRVIQMLTELLDTLGFADSQVEKFKTVSSYVEHVTDRKLKSFAYLTVGK